MAKPVNNERRNKEVNYVIENGTVTISDLAKIFQVTTETIRKDLTYLDEKQILNKGHGVVTAASSYIENPFAIKSNENIEAKTRIAQIAAKLIPKNGVVLLDSGTTVMQLAKLLNLRDDLIIFTNSMIATQILSNSKNQLIVTGGELRHNSFSYVGNFALQVIKQIKVDIAFIACDGFHENGPSIRSYREIEIKQAMLKSAKESVLLADTSKISKEGLYCFAQFTELDSIIVDEELSPEQRKKFPKSLKITYF